MDTVGIVDVLSSSYLTLFARALLLLAGGLLGQLHIVTLRGRRVRVFPFLLRSSAQHISEYPNMLFLLMLNFHVMFHDEESCNLCTFRFNKKTVK